METPVSRSALYGKLAGPLFRSLESATAFCKLRSNPWVELTHWLHQLTQQPDNDILHVLRHYQIPLSDVEKALLRQLDMLPAGASAISDFSHHIDLSVEKAWMLASVRYGDNKIRSGWLLLALLTTPELRRVLSSICAPLATLPVDELTEILPSLIETSPEAQERPYDGSGLASAIPGESSQAIPNGGQDGKSALAKYCQDMTAQARDGKIDPVTGREHEIRTMTDILLRRRQNNPLLTGEAGVGKTAVVEGFALAIAQGEVPPALREVRLLALDVGALLAGASMKGEFESRLKGLLEEAGRSPQPVILFVDEVHTLVGAGGASGTGDAANLLKPAQARGTPGVECLSPQVLTGDNGLTLIENAPWGVVASVTPSTNPAATVINNAISLIAAGNSVVFAPHPAAKKVSQRAITLLNQAVVAAGGPENLLVTVANPDIETAQRLFKYPGIGLLVVTGGEAVVDAARKHTNKRLIAAGAGNPPVVVDETADLPRAAQSIVKGASFDNNIICADEKVLIVVDSVADELMRLMEGQHAVKLTAAQAEQLQPVLLKNIDERGKGTVSRDWVGRDAGKIAAAIGLNVPDQTRLLFVETPANHPFAVTEMMMPVLPVVRVANVEEAIALAVQLEGGCHHTAAMHSRNIDNMNQMANAIDTSIFVKNGPCIAGLGLGGEGWTTMTITTPTGEGVTSARTFVRLRRCVLVDAFRIV